MKDRTICAKKMRLLDKYVAAASALLAATTDLRLTTGVGFQKALAALKRHALLIHRDLHSC